MAKTSLVVSCLSRVARTEASNKRIQRTGDGESGSTERMYRRRRRARTLYRKRISGGGKAWVAFNEIGLRGKRLVAEHLTALGRTVAPSDRKTFDLVGDGKYAEMKTSNGPYSKHGFIGPTDAQYRELVDGTSVTIFVVCNAAFPDRLEVVEFDAAELLKEKPTVGCTYYWYRKQLDKCRADAGVKLPPAAIGTPAPSTTSVGASGQPVVEPSGSGTLIAYIRCLSVSNEADLYVRFDMQDLERNKLEDRQLVELELAGTQVVGIVRTTGIMPWLAPATRMRECLPCCEKPVSSMVMTSVPARRPLMALSESSAHRYNTEWNGRGAVPGIGAQALPPAAHL